MVHRFHPDNRVFIISAVVLMVLVNSFSIWQIFDEKQIKSNKFSSAITTMIDKGLPERADGLDSLKYDLSLKEMAGHLQNIADSFEDNSMSLFHLDEGSNITSAMFGFDRSDKLHTLANRSTDVGEVLAVTSYTNLTQFKEFLIQYKNIKLNIDGLRLSERTIRNDLVCYVFNISVTYDYFYLKTAKVRTRVEVVQNCGSGQEGFYYELQESRNLFAVQLIFGIFFLYKGIKTWFDLTRIIERISVKLRHPNLGGKKEDVELDFNFYRFMLSRNVKSSIITKTDLRYFSTTNICIKLVRPLYYVCMFGYLMQIFSASYMLYGVYYMEVVTQAQLNLCAIAIMCSWFDLYTITSQSNETGLVNDTFLQVYKQFLYFTAYILIVMAAFAAFALCIFNHSIHFSNLVGTVVALFAFMYGDNIRSTFLTYQDNPFSIVFLVSIIIVLYSCLAQFYLAVFTIKFQTTSDKTNKLITMLNRNKEGFMRMQKEIIDSKSKKFSEEISFLMDYLGRKSKIIQGGTVVGGPGSLPDSGVEDDEPDLLPAAPLGQDQKRLALDEDIRTTFNEARLPEKHKKLLRKT